VTGSGLKLRLATLDDVGMIADLETARTPDDPRDGDMIAFWWTHPHGGERSMRLVAERDGVVNLFVTARHDTWQKTATRFGRLKVSLHPNSWTDEVFHDGVGAAESWLRSEEARTCVAQVREDLNHELTVLDQMGYREVRRHRFWELDLVAQRDQLLARADRCRAEMRKLGINLITLDQDRDPDALRKLYELDIEATGDIPTTVPFPVPSFDEWSQMYFDNPGIRKDRFWIARMADAIVGMSLIEYPPGRGLPSTEFTGTLPRVRGRGIARALKYETVVQAIALGATRLRTDNDAENAPILHLNAEMGYRAVNPGLELHRDINA
jgi:GNAT superfamily N-acetyltransferase